MRLYCSLAPCKQTQEEAHGRHRTVRAPYVARPSRSGNFKGATSSAHCGASAVADFTLQPRDRR